MHHYPKSREIRRRKVNGRGQNKRPDVRSSLKSLIPSRKYKKKGSRRGKKLVKHRTDSRPSTPSLQAQTTSPVQHQTDRYEERAPAESIIRQDITKCNTLCYGAYLGNETRALEFKRGGGMFFEKFFHETLLIYGCAFMNTEGGSLVVGVSDDGVVLGVQFSHKKEDMTRLQVDEWVKKFVPPLFPQNYSLKFLPVIKIGQQECNLKVLCLTFRAHSAYTKPTLYSVNKGDVYLRRDASVEGPLKHDVIEEWYKQMSPRSLQQDLHVALSRNKILVEQIRMQKQTASRADPSIQGSDAQGEEDPASFGSQCLQTSRCQTSSQHRSPYLTLESDRSQM